MNITGFTNNSIFPHAARSAFGHVSGADNSSGDKKLTDIAKEKNADSIRRLSEMSDSEKQEAAVSSYIEMQSTLLREMAGRKKNIETVGAIKEDIAYLSDVLAKNEGKDVIDADACGEWFSSRYGTSGTYSRAKLEEALEMRKSALESFTAPKPTPYDNIGAVIFTNAAARFETATGLTADCLDLDGDDSLCTYREDLTADNFAEKMNETVDKLAKRSEALSDLMARYKETEQGAGLDSSLDITEKYKLSYLETVRMQFLQNGNVDDPERTIGRLNALA